MLFSALFSTSVDSLHLWVPKVKTFATNLLNFIKKYFTLLFSCRTYIDIYELGTYFHHNISSKFASGWKGICEDINLIWANKNCVYIPYVPMFITQCTGMVVYDTWYSYYMLCNVAVKWIVFKQNNKTNIAVVVFIYLIY